MEKQLRIKNVRINCRILAPKTKTKSKPKYFVILHGWNGSSQSWLAVGVLLQELGYTVVIPEWPGCGQSGEPLQAWQTDDYVEMMEEFLHQMNIEKPIVLGHSHGGRVLLKMLAKKDCQFEKIFVFAAAGVPHKLTPKQQAARVIAKIGKPFLYIPFFGKITNFLRSLVYRAIGGHDYLALRSDQMRQTMNNVLREDLTPLLPKIADHIILIWGDADTYTPLADGQLMNRLLPDSELTVVPGARHGYHLHDPENFFALLRSHL